jgi:hypothetical protein
MDHQASAPDSTGAAIGQRVDPAERTAFVLHDVFHAIANPDKLAHVTSLLQPA